MKRMIFVAAILLAGCDQTEQKPADTTTATNTTKTATPTVANPSVQNAPAGDRAAADNRTVADNRPAADNTDKNERDRSGATLTPFDQGENEADRKVSQHIRQSVVSNDAISASGKNIKIITVDGVVTLRGPVKTAGEKSQIAAIASGTSGVKRVDNQLEIAAN